MLKLELIFLYLLGDSSLLAQDYCALKWKVVFNCVILHLRSISLWWLDVVSKMKILKLSPEFSALYKIVFFVKKICIYTSCTNWRINLKEYKCHWQWIILECLLSIKVFRQSLKHRKMQNTSVALHQGPYSLMQKARVGQS